MKTRLDPTKGCELEDFELAFARLEWVRASSCLDLPSQREALAWHVARCDEALRLVEHMPPDRADL